MATIRRVSLPLAPVGAARPSGGVAPEARDPREGSTEYLVDAAIYRRVILEEIPSARCTSVRLKSWLYVGCTSYSQSPPQAESRSAASGVGPGGQLLRRRGRTSSPCPIQRRVALTSAVAAHGPPYQNRTPKPRDSTSLSPASFKLFA